MSLNRPVVALGALVVVALGIVGGEVAYASGQPKPAPFVSISQGNSYAQAEPACWNDGKALGTADYKKCSATKKNTTDFTVNVNGTTTAIGVSDPGAAGKGWFLAANGQALTGTYHSTYQHLSLASIWNSSSPLTSSDSIVIEVVVGDPTSGSTYGVWNFTVHKAS
jgi:hypothetical protein